MSIWGRDEKAFFLGAAFGAIAAAAGFALADFSIGFWLAGI